MGIKIIASNHGSADVAHRDEREEVGKEEEVKKNKKQKTLNVYEKVKKIFLTCLHAFAY